MVTTRSRVRRTPGVTILNTQMKHELRKTLSAKSTIHGRYGQNNAKATFQGEEDNIAVEVTYNKNAVSNAFKVNPKIPELDDGVYTYIIDVKNGVPSLKCSPVQMFEAGSKHIQLAKNSDDIFAGGEFKKTGTKIEYNLQSGTFRYINRTMLPGGRKFTSAVRHALQHRVIQHVFKSLGATSAVSTGHKALIDEFGNLWKKNAGRFLLENPGNLRGLKSYKLKTYIGENYVNIPQRVINKYKELRKSKVTKNVAYKRTISNFINKAKKMNTLISTLKGGYKTQRKGRLLFRRGGNRRLYYQSQRNALGLPQNATDAQVENKMKNLMPNLDKYKKNLSNLLK